MPTARVMTYNIWMGGRRGVPLHRVVRDVAADVVLVNEAPKRPLLSGRDCRRLAHRWQLHYVAGGRTAGSNMVATAARVETRWSESWVLRQPPLQPRRGIAVAQLKLRGQLLGVVSCHLSLDESRRVAEARAVVAAATRLRGPVVLAGDLNERPDGPAWQVFTEAGWVDHGNRGWRTFPAADPNARIDALLVRGAGVRVSHHGDPGIAPPLLAAASDHRPVLAHLEW